VIAVVGTAFDALPPVPPNAGSRGAEKRDEVDNREAREPGRSGEDGLGGCCRPGAIFAGRDEAGGEDEATGSGGEGVRTGEGTIVTGVGRVGSTGSGSEVTVA
jgi:hypothetical protein